MCILVLRSVVSLSKTSRTSVVERQANLPGTRRGRAPRNVRILAQRSREQLARVLCTSCSEGKRCILVRVVPSPCHAVPFYRESPSASRIDKGKAQHRGQSKRASRRLPPDGANRREKRTRSGETGSAVLRGERRDAHLLDAPLMNEKD